jgi:Heterokaryon incompatibility protein (HET)
MRLLKVDPTGGFSLTKDLPDNEALKYAILSHTWHQDNNQKVTSEDLNKGTGKGKIGYKKISFCAEQAIQDGIQYIWVDTCCIDKSNNNINKAIELQYAINSMFRWYQNAAKCYVYLEDVSVPEVDAGGESHQRLWELSLRKSRWFTRGWTLQELIAPKVVEFFSENWCPLGSKASLER